MAQFLQRLQNFGAQTTQDLMILARELFSNSYYYYLEVKNHNNLYIGQIILRQQTNSGLSRQELFLDKNRPQQIARPSIPAQLAVKLSFPQPFVATEELSNILPAMQPFQEAVAQNNNYLGSLLVDNTGHAWLSVNSQQPQLDIHDYYQGLQAIACADIVNVTGREIIEEIMAQEMPETKFTISAFGSYKHKIQKKMLKFYIFAMTALVFQSYFYDPHRYEFPLIENKLEYEIIYGKKKI